MNKFLLFGFFAAAVLAQWLFPVSLIANRNQVIRSGAVFRFECEPVDPRDLFRGQYLVLSFKANSWRCQACNHDSLPASGWALLSTDGQGFAQIDSVSVTRPNEGDYLKVQLQPGWFSDRKVRVNYPFDRYYISERLAQRAEDAYQRAMQDTGSSAYALVRVLDGEAVLEEVFVNGKPIREVAGEARKAN